MRFKCTVWGSWVSTRSLRIRGGLRLTDKGKKRKPNLLGVKLEEKEIDVKIELTYCEPLIYKEPK